MGCPCNGSACSYDRSHGSGHWKNHSNFKRKWAIGEHDYSFLSDNGASAGDAAAYGPGFNRPSETRDGRKIVYAINKDALPRPETTYSSIGKKSLVKAAFIHH